MSPPKDYLRELRVPVSRGQPFYVQIYSKYSRFRYDEHFEVWPAWRERYERNVKCAGCEWPNRRWQEKPLNLDVELVGSFPGCVTGTLGCPVDLYRSDLRDVFLPYADGLVWGRAYLRDRGRRTRLPFWTVQAPRSEQVNSFRGPGAGHKMCGVCGRVCGGGKEAFVARDVRTRAIVASDAGVLYVRSDVAETLRLRQRFEDLRLYKIPVVDEPLDGWTLPGDPGWDGVLRIPECWLRQEQERLEWVRRVRAGEIDI